MNWWTRQFPWRHGPIPHLTEAKSGLHTTYSSMKRRGEVNSGTNRACISTSVEQTLWGVSSRSPLEAMPRCTGRDADSKPYTNLQATVPPQPMSTSRLIMTWRSADRVVERKTVAVRPPHAFSEEVMSLASGVGVCIVFPLSRSMGVAIPYLEVLYRLASMRGVRAIIEQLNLQSQIFNLEARRRDSCRFATGGNPNISRFRGVVGGVEY